MVKGGPAKIDGEYHNETDNFQPIKFKLNGIEFFSAENYFQCMKTTSKEEFEKIRNSGCGMDVNLFLIFFFSNYIFFIFKVWSAGSRVNLRSDWEAVKVNVMYEGNKAKFDQHKDLAEKLMNTKGDVIFGGSTSFWNKWNGLIMERIRAELRDRDEEDKKTVERIKKMMEEYQKSQTK